MSDGPCAGAVRQEPDQTAHIAEGRHAIAYESVAHDF
jgi:hypothetical protein